MSNTRAMQLAAITSVNEETAPRAMQLSAIVSITDIPQARAMQLVTIFSVTPPPRYVYGAERVKASSGFNLMVDMFSNSRR